MNIRRAGFGLFLAMIVLGLAALACGQLGLTGQSPQGPIWTPAAVTAAAPQQSAAGQQSAAEPTAGIAGAILPTRPAPTWVAPTPFPLEMPPGLSAATPATGAAAVVAPTVDPHIVIISEADIAQAIAGGAAEGNGLHVTNLVVRFTGGKTIITAEQVSYGFITVQNLAIVGRLVARDGALQMETESISPQNLVTSMIPGLINQAFKQYTSQWYVEDVQTLEGHIELHIR